MTQTPLLPNNRTAFELAVSQVGAERRSLPTHLVSSVWSPDNCPEHLLGWLAWQLSVDIWDENWPETTKRSACRKALLLHRVKTTLGGIKAHVSQAGSDVRRAVRPPAKGFLYAAMTDEQRAAWLDSLPQIRVYPFFRRSIAKSRSFFSGPGGRQFHSLRQFDVDAPWGWSPVGVPTPALRSVSGFLRTSRGRSLYGRRATYYDRSVETEVGYEAFDGQTVERVLLTGRRKRAWHGAGFTETFLTPSVAANNVITIRLSEDAPLLAVSRGAEPVDVRPQRIQQRRIAPDARSFCGRFREGRFLKGTFAPLLIYDRISLHDSERMGARRKTRNYHGYGRFGIPDYTAELRIRVPMHRPPRRSGLWHGAGYRKAPDYAPLERAIEAVRVSKAFRDTVMIDTATYGQVKFDGELRFGEFSFGEIKEVA